MILPESHTARIIDHVSAKFDTFLEISDQAFRLRVMARMHDGAVTGMTFAQIAETIHADYVKAMRDAVRKCVLDATVQMQEGSIPPSPPQSFDQ